MCLLKFVCEYAKIKASLNHNNHSNRNELEKKEEEEEEKT